MVWIIVNPAAGAGKALIAGQRLGRLLPDSVLKTTERPGQATDFARLAVLQGVDLVVSVGGDGTLQEITTGLCIDESGTGRVSPTKLFLLPGGSGGDYQRTLGVGPSPEEAATRLARPDSRWVDVGIVDYVDHRGSPTRSAFLNVLSFGLGGLTTQLVEGSPKWLGGRLTYLLGALRANLVHRPSPVRLWADDRLLGIAPYANVAVCLGRYFGGGMEIAPDAQIDDGLFDVVTIDADRLRVALLSLDIYRGTHVERESVGVHQARKIVAEPTTTAEVLLDLDGNQPGRLPISVEVLPRALQLVH